MGNALTWLHLSDIHFQQEKAWRDNDSTQQLLVFLEHLFKEDQSNVPALIFCTGDIAYGETSGGTLSDQYSSAKKFFDNLLAICGPNGRALPKDRLFVVPGNHDVNRKSINKDAQSHLYSWAEKSEQHVEEVNQRFDDRSTEFRDAVKRLQEYDNFIKDYLPHQHDNDGRQYYCRKVNLDGVVCGIAGLNSAWSCAGPEDDRNIWLAAQWQFSKARSLLSDATIKIGLIHHPVDWLNNADRDHATRAIASDFDFWLHGHSHNAWVTPTQSHVQIGAGAVGASLGDEFGVNLVRFAVESREGAVHLFSKRSGNSGWTIAPVSTHAPKGVWSFSLPNKGGAIGVSSSVAGSRHAIDATASRCEDIAAKLSGRLKNALFAFSSQPKVWIAPTLNKQPETTREQLQDAIVSTSSIVDNPKSMLIKAPPQYGLTCLSHHLVEEAWRRTGNIWLYLDSKTLKPNTKSLNNLETEECEFLDCTKHDVKCVVLDGWSAQEKGANEILENVCSRFKDLPVICMQCAESDVYGQAGALEMPRPFEELYLWALPRNQIREIVAAYNNDIRVVGDEDVVTKRIVSDLNVLNLHRTPLNCLTLLKVSELDFDESPVNRSEMISRVLFLLFNVEKLPTYTTRPDLKDCEYVLGYFCELLIRDGEFFFSRDTFLSAISACCKQSLIDLETHYVFDVLAANNIVVRRGSFFTFKFAYWIYYFAAHRMIHSPEFAAYIFDEHRYANYPEIIEFYTGIDRRRRDALEKLILDVRILREVVKKDCGLPEGFNPYPHLTWSPNEFVRKKMFEEIRDGVRESNLPSAIKDQYADRFYDRATPFDQSVRVLLQSDAFTAMMGAMKAASRALRNSDYVAPEIKRELLEEILCCWDQASRVLLVVLPLLAQHKHAKFGRTGFSLHGNFSDSIEDRAVQILECIPSNVVTWTIDDLYSKKMGALLSDQFSNPKVSAISKHELMLLIIEGRPNNWRSQVERYIVSVERDSFYLHNVHESLRGEYRYSYASSQTLKDLDFLIRKALTKHMTGENDPGLSVIQKTMKRVQGQVIPTRENRTHE